jgi:hypothetical protein
MVCLKSNLLGSPTNFYFKNNLKRHDEKSLSGERIYALTAAVVTRLAGRATHGLTVLS